jgi:hypothetical protein
MAWLQLILPPSKTCRLSHPCWIPSQSSVYPVTMPCRDKSDSLLANLRKMGQHKPPPLCRVPARGCQPILNLLILMAKLCKSRILTLGQARDKRVTTLALPRPERACTRVETGYMARVPRQWPGPCAGFALPISPRPAIFGDFWGSFEGKKRI